MNSPAARENSAPAPKPPDSAAARWAARLRVIGYQRFALGMVIALIVLMMVPQIREFLLIYRILSWPGLSELAFVSVSALAAWYAGRMAYRIDPNPRERGTALELQLHPGLRRWLPRIYALAVPLAPAGACFELELYEKAAMYAAIALVLFLGVSTRRQMMQKVMKHASAPQLDAAEDRIADDWRDLGKSEKRVIAAALITAGVLGVLSTLKPEWAAGAFGTPGILFLSGSVVAILGTVAVQQLVRLQLPFTTMLVLVLVVVALIPIGKLHRIRSADPDPATQQERDQAPRFDPFARAKPVLVAAEGGGIRAAYWSALGLHTLDLLTDGAFREHVSLASGVSGGSLGLATYARSPDAPTISEDDCTVPPIAWPDSPQARALNLGHCFLAEDYLGPVALRLLWHDMPRLFAPIPFWTDRGEALEDGWSRQWKRLSQRDDFNGPLSQLAPPGAPGTTPATDAPAQTLWVFNSTHVESGSRVIQSAPWIPDLPKLAPAAIDGRDAVGLDIELKQAVHNSARFTYVSPSGAVVRDDDSVLQLVDGGYFENSGLTLVNDYLIYEPDVGGARVASESVADPFSAYAAKQMAVDAPMIDGLSRAAEDADPIVLLFTNDPSIAPPLPPHCNAATPSPRGRDVNEIIAPLVSLLEVRSARGTYAREQTQRLVGKEDFFQLAIRDRGNDITVPLGWALSEESIQEMQEQMWCEAGECEVSNVAPLLGMVARIGGDVDAARGALARLCRIAKDASP
jgi:hypothetical protein